MRSKKCATNVVTATLTRAWRLVCFCSRRCRRPFEPVKTARRRPATRGTHHEPWHRTGAGTFSKCPALSEPRALLL